LTTLSGGIVLTAIGFDKIVRPVFYGLLARLPEVHCAENRVGQCCQTRFSENTASGNIAKSGKGVKNTRKQSHRTCVRMSAKDYDLLKKKSTAAGLSANAWLMAQLAANRPALHREEETWDAIHFMDAAGREINAIARDFNSGYGTAEQLQYAVRLLGDVYERIYTLRKKGYIRAA